MKIKEIAILAEQDRNNTLRLPKPAEKKSKEELLMYEKIMSAMVAGVIENPQADILLKDLSVIESLKQDGIRQLRKIDYAKGVYKINTQYGSTEFYDAHRLFIGGRYPQWLKPGLCYSNCYTYALSSKTNSKVVSGIAFMGDTTFLHSVVVIADKVIDFNYNIVMSFEMYKKMFCFEILAELESKRIKDTNAWFELNYELLNSPDLQTYTLNFAHEDLLNYIKKNGKRPNLNAGTTI